MAATVRDLKVYQEAVALAGDIIRAVRQSARRETKVVGDHLMLLAAAVAEHIADGYSRYTTLEQQQLYRAAKQELLKVDAYLGICRHADIISAAAYGDLISRSQIVHRLLGGYLVYLERQLAEELPAPVGGTR
jgi:four helix bundle protein